MINVDQKKFEALEAALMDCMTGLYDQAGLRVVPHTARSEDVEMVAVAALTMFSGMYVKPKNVEFPKP